MSSEDDALIRSCLDSIKESIEQQAREFEVARVVDTLEAAHRSRTKLYEKIYEQHREAMRLTIAESDKGSYYKWVDTHVATSVLHPDTVAETKAALDFACNDLNLHDLPIHIAWFEPLYCGTVEYRRRMLAQDPEIFSAEWGLRGSICWTDVTENGRVAISTNLSFSTAKTCLHECRHVWQRLQHGPEQPIGSFLNELERDADDYASTHYEVIRFSR